MKYINQTLAHRTVPWMAWMGIIMIASLWMIACKDESATNLNDIVFPASNISYSKNVQPLFTRGCVFAGCHGPDTYLERGFSLESYQSLTPGAAHEIVVPGDPDNSKLIWSIEGTNGFETTRRMPMGLSPLNDNQLQGLRRWIAEGAKNN